MAAARTCVSLSASSGSACTTRTMAITIGARTTPPFTSLMMSACRPGSTPRMRPAAMAPRGVPHAAGAGADSVATADLRRVRLLLPPDAPHQSHEQRVDRPQCMRPHTAQRSHGSGLMLPSEPLCESTGCARTWRP